MSSDGNLILGGVTVTLDGAALIAGLDLTVAPGEIVTVMGPSGSGKSTLLAWLCGSVDPAFGIAGSATLDGKDITRLPPEARRVGILFQDDLLFPHLSVGDNLAFGVPPSVARGERRQRIEAALEEAELPGFADRDPAALLLDEPFSRLDAALRDRIRCFVFGHATERGLPVLLVTHDPDDATAAGGAVIQLSDDRDRRSEQGSPAEP
jgi:putative thiamine transport system ATP-binding protein